MLLLFVLLLMLASLAIVTGDSALALLMLVLHVWHDVGWVLCRLANVAICHTLGDHFFTVVIKVLHWLVGWARLLLEWVLNEVINHSWEHVSLVLTSWLARSHLVQILVVHGKVVELIVGSIEHIWSGALRVVASSTTLLVHLGYARVERDEALVALYSWLVTIALVLNVDWPEPKVLLLTWAKVSLNELDIVHCCGLRLKLRAYHMRSLTSALVDTCVLLHLLHHESVVETLCLWLRSNNWWVLISIENVQPVLLLILQVWWRYECSLIPLRSVRSVVAGALLLHLGA